MFDEVLKHCVHVRRNTDWRSAVMFTHCGFFIVFWFTHNAAPGQKLVVKRLRERLYDHTTVGWFSCSLTYGRILPPITVLDEPFDMIV